MAKKISFILLFFVLSIRVALPSPTESQVNTLVGKMVPGFLNFLYSEEAETNPIVINSLIEFFDWNAIFKRSGIEVGPNNRTPLAKHYLLDLRHHFKENRLAIEEQMHLDTIRNYLTEERIEKLFFLISSLDPQYQLSVEGTEIVLRWRGLTLYLVESSKDALLITGFQFEI